VNAMHEDTALTKRCPLAVGAAGVGYNWILCKGSNCMGWRWEKPPARRKVMCDIANAQTEPKRPRGVGEDYEFVPAKRTEKAGSPHEFEYGKAHWVEPKRERKGYCGMAGSP
jgi:hypothetical protein